MKLKKCPACGALNPLRNTVCENEACGESLLRAPIVDPEAKKREPSETQAEQASMTPAPAPAAAPSSRPSFSRKCPNCGRELPYRIKTCECGTSLIAVPPIADTAASAEAPASEPMTPARFLLRSEDGQASLPLCDGDDIVIGRHATCASYLACKEFVSGAHAQISVSGENVTIEHTGRTNPTLVNGVKIASNTPYRLSPGDLIAFGAQPGQGYHALAAYVKLVKDDTQ